MNCTVTPCKVLFHSRWGSPSRGTRACQYPMEQAGEPCGNPRSWGRGGPVPDTGLLRHLVIAQLWGMFTVSLSLPGWGMGRFVSSGIQECSAHRKHLGCALPWLQSLPQTQGLRRTHSLPPSWGTGRHSVAGLCPGMTTNIPSNPSPATPLGGQTRLPASLSCGSRSAGPTVGAQGRRLVWGRKP